ncbi:MAG: hypothetical protein HY564_00580 [Candidatus Jacksonbacteria bacterium]|nr:hypothetical protein [Candidatus Jacksonbacteria bacterium]
MREKENELQQEIQKNETPWSRYWNEQQKCFLIPYSDSALGEETIEDDSESGEKIENDLGYFDLEDYDTVIPLEDAYDYFKQTKEPEETFYIEYPEIDPNKYPKADHEYRENCQRVEDYNRKLREYLRTLGWEVEEEVF